MRHHLFFLLLLMAAAYCQPSDLLAEGGKCPGTVALELRQFGDLVSYAPSKAMLAAYFTANEVSPAYVYGPISAYQKSRPCPTAWLIEKGELARLNRLKAEKDPPPYEFSLTLETDCPSGKVTHAVFVSAPGSTPEAWLKWRSQFHGRKTEGYYATALERLKKAERAELAPTAELRFLAVNGELSSQSPEQELKSEGRLTPVFDLETGAAPVRPDR